MENLNRLQNEQVSLNAMVIGLDEEIEHAKAKVERSFTGKGETDKLTNNLTLLQTKRGSLSNAITNASQAIADEQRRLVDEEHTATVKAKHKHVEQALLSVEKAHELQKQLTAELLKVANHNANSLTDSSELIQQPRIILGKIANELKLFGALSNAHTLPILTTADAERIQSRIK